MHVCAHGKRKYSRVCLCVCTAFSVQPVRLKRLTYSFCLCICVVYLNDMEEFSTILQSGFFTVTVIWFFKPSLLNGSCFTDNTKHCIPIHFRFLSSCYARYERTPREYYFYVDPCNYRSHNTRVFQKDSQPVSEQEIENG